ncbi:MAG: ferredoxin [Candidatus Omnitrophica bacterium]|nr:ferredoxin [Candidatus Omnitrophota bacterium]
MVAKVIDETCVGCGLCVDACPEVFVMEGDKAIVKGDAIPAEAKENAEKAKSDCPVEAITIEG